MADMVFRSHQMRKQQAYQRFTFVRAVGLPVTATCHCEWMYIHSGGLLK